jgi:hypothetical protein
MPLTTPHNRRRFLGAATVGGLAALGGRFATSSANPASEERTMEQTAMTDDPLPNRRSSISWRA